MEHIHLYEEPEFDAETQERLDSQVDKLLKGYDWTLAPLANKYVTLQIMKRLDTPTANFPVKQGIITKLRRDINVFIHLASVRRRWRLLYLF